MIQVKTEFGPEDSGTILGRARYMEFVGGLGDVLNRCHQCPWYESIADLAPDEEAALVLLSHNPATLSLFRHHPTRGTLRIYDLGFDGRFLNPIWRASMGLPSETGFVPKNVDRIALYPAPEDVPVLAALPDRYVAFIASAGTPERNLPEPIVEDAVDVALSLGFSVVFLGGTYVHRYRSLGSLGPGPRHELRPRLRPGVISLIDRLSVPGAGVVLDGAWAVFTAHTALCLFAWYRKRPTFLLYNDFIARTYVPLGPAGYLFGLARPENAGLEIPDYRSDRWKAFLSRP